MRCTSPRTVGFLADGKTISWSKNQYSREYAPFQLPCGKCLECRLDYARQWAVRCVHEAQMHEHNCFITLTYSDDNLKSPKLVYSDFQKFMKKIRKQQRNPIGFFVTGEYGERTKRPHWHAILFNYAPKDSAALRTTENGDRVYSSETLSRLWGKGLAEFGSVTMESAGYCARYAAKKLVHGRDGDHEYEPISKKSNKHAIGKRWLEKYWQDVFAFGQIVLPEGKTCSVPRYYEKWLKENKPEGYYRYVTGIKSEKSELAAQRCFQEAHRHTIVNDLRRLRTQADGQFRGHGTSVPQARATILRSKFKILQDHLKL